MNTETSLNDSLNRVLLFDTMFRALSHVTRNNIVKQNFFDNEAKFC